jgi:hypothetical protein
VLLLMLRIPKIIYMTSSSWFPFGIIFFKKREQLFLCCRRCRRRNIFRRRKEEELNEDHTDRTHTSGNNIVYISDRGGDYDQLLVISITFFSYTSNDSCNRRLAYFNALAYVRVSSTTHYTTEEKGAGE